MVCIVLSILFGVVPCLVNKIFDGLASTLFNCPFIEEAVYLKGFDCVSIALDKNRRWVLGLWAPKKVFSRQES